MIKMTTLEIAIAKIKKLPIEQRNEVIEFIEFLEFKLGKISHIQNLEDLSYNPKYMQGFGK
jgi:hypothetical protein